MKLKDGVVIAGLDIKVRPALIVADKIWKKYGHELVITCGLNGCHSAGSLHYYGLAIDCRSKYFTETEKHSIHNELKVELDKDFDIILHNSHFHIEYDPK